VLGSSRSIRRRSLTKSEKPTRQTAEQTRVALTDTALRFFGEDGFAATSTRDIAAAAGANIASISYHFGSKEGLRMACATMIVEKFRGLTGPAMQTVVTENDPDGALERIEEALISIIRFLNVQPEARQIAAFMMREMGHPSPAFDLIYSELMLPFHTAICRLWAISTGCTADDPATRLTVFSILGQVFYFRMAQPIVLRRMEWHTIDDDKVEQIITTITGNLRTLARAAQET